MSFIFLLGRFQEKSIHVAHTPPCQTKITTSGSISRNKNPPPRNSSLLLRCVNTLKRPTVHWCCVFFFWMEMEEVKNQLVGTNRPFFWGEVIFLKMFCFMFLFWANVVIFWVGQGCGVTIGSKLRPTKTPSRGRSKQMFKSFKRIALSTNPVEIFLRILRPQNCLMLRTPNTSLKKQVQSPLEFPSSSLE